MSNSRTNLIGSEEERTVHGEPITLGLYSFDHLGDCLCVTPLPRLLCLHRGASRNIITTDPLGNSTENTFDGNGNTIGVVRSELCTIPGVSTIESFASAMAYDVLNRLIVDAEQGPDGILNPVPNTCCAPPATTNNTLFTLSGYDSRNNRPNLIDSKLNTTVSVLDGASRQLQTLQHLRTAGSGSNPIFDTVTTTDSWDANSNMIRLVDDRGGTTTWDYDLLDRQTVMIFHDGSTRTNVYDAANDITGYTDGRIQH